ncbi:hypothetical protein [Paludibaculum fermentans]|uniref:hypothetical protein n=1 Tax=Paludibaculum fermentans TaxID=1473598 RepID=UPI003EBCF82B
MQYLQQGLLPAFVLAALLCHPLGGREPKPISNWSNLSGLTAGSEIRVTLAGGQQLRGFLLRVTPESVLLNATTSQETLARAAILRVALKKPGRRGRNTLIGLGIGAAGGLAIGAGIDARSNSGGWFQNAGKGVIGPLGAILGTVVGVAWPTGGWKDVYRVP